jgi:endonuclease/exonuclease/phosphatase family metal-dependent hydrolase
MLLAHMRGRDNFLEWFQAIHMPDEITWLIVGDFNLIQRPKDRNKEGGDVQEMYLFNEAISKLGLVEIPLQGRRFTWTNKRPDPLLERLDWFFSSASWTLKYLNTMARSLIMEVSDHWPCVIDVVTFIPKPRIFRFENCWLQHDSFLPTVHQSWTSQPASTDPARSLTE